MSVNSPVAGLRDEVLAGAVAPASVSSPATVLVPARAGALGAQRGAERDATRSSARRTRRLPGAHRDPRCTFWRTVAQELVYFGTACSVRPWRSGR